MKRELKILALIGMFISFGISAEANPLIAMSCTKQEYGKTDQSQEAPANPNGDAENGANKPQGCGVKSHCKSNSNSKCSATTHQKSNPSEQQAPVRKSAAQKIIQGG